MGLRAGKISTAKDSKSNRSFSPPKEKPKSLFIQPSLTIGPVDDVYQREADTVADKVMRMSDTEQKQTNSSAINIQAKCPACAEEEQIHRKENGNEAGLLEAPSIVSDALRSGGSPLDDNSRSFMESRFGYDFSRVKIHTDSSATKSAQSINALAYTSGNNIVFNEGQYSPNTENGKKLLAHELTHVVHQGKGLQNKTIQRQSKKPEWCSPFMDLVRYEDEHGKLGVLMTYNPFALSLLPPLNKNIPSIYGEVDVDWMLRLALSQYLTVFVSIFSPSSAELIGMASANEIYFIWKPFWNTLRASFGYATNFDPWKDFEYASVFEEANRNAPMVIRIWFHRETSLRDIFAPAITLCEGN